VCVGGAVTITFNLPDDDDGEGFDVTYSIGGNTFNLLAIVNGHTENHVVTASTTATLSLVENNDDDDDDCFTVFSQTISIAVSNPALNVTNQADPTCGQNNGSITVSAFGGVTPYQYSLNANPPQSGGTFSGLGAGAYNLTVEDAIGCTDQVTVTLDNPGAPTLTISNQTNPSCGQSNGSITASASGGVSPYQFSLNGGAFQSSGAFTGLGAGNYTVVAKDNAGCTGSISVTLSSQGGPTLAISGQTNPACGQSNGSITASASGGTLPYQYSLGGANYQSSPVFNGLAAGAYQVYVRDAAACIDIKPVTLTDAGANLPQANIFANTTQGCASTVFSLTGNLPNGTTGAWSSADVQPPSPANPVWTLSDLPPGTTTLAWTLSAPGCPNYDAAMLTLDVLPPPEANDDGIFDIPQGEFGETAVLLNDAIAAPVAVRILKNPAQGTAFFDSQNVLEYQPGLNADGADTVIYEICYFECPDACDTASVFFRNLRNDDPCVITGDTSNVFTNGLTPNGDGRNDRLFFQIVSVENCEINYAKSEIIIYNRWGDIVFEASPYNNDWEGKNRDGKDLPPGVYYFVLRVTLDRVYSQFGSVILIR
jgi:gliding motility-associated-like protein